MEFKAPVVLKKRIKKGTMVGYGNSYKSKSDMDIAIVQCGYGDGIPFEYSNKGFVYFNKLKMTIIVLVVFAIRYHSIIFFKL